MKILCLGDIHVGSTIAPWPNISLPEGGEYLPSLTQTWLNAQWKEMLRLGKEFDPDAVVVNGDIIDGDRTQELVTNRLDYQSAAAVELLGPICEGRKVYLIRGTAYHTGELAQYETSIARELKAKEHPKTNEPTWPFLFLDIGEGIAHFAHHIGFTANPMYEATALMSGLVTIRNELYNNYGRGCPDVSMIVRSHRHHSLCVNKGRLWALALPSWQMMTQYAYKVQPNRLPEIGFAMIETDPVRVTIHKFQLPKPHIER